MMTRRRPSTCPLAMTTLVISTLSLSACDSGNTPSDPPTTTASVTNAPDSNTTTNDNATPTTVPATNKPPRDALRDRATRLWAARVEDDCAITYDYMDPSKLETVSQDDYCAWWNNESPFLYTAGTIKDLAVEEPFGWIHIESSVGVRQFPDLPSRAVTRWEPWWLIGGTWYPVPPEAPDVAPAAPAERDREEEKRLRERFDLAWEARLQENWEQMKALTDPNDATSGDETSILYVSCDVHWVQVIGDRGEIRMNVAHKLKDFPKRPAEEMAVVEKWVRRDGQWYMDLEPSK